jgi:fatty-acyl-CoA synthase
MALMREGFDPDLCSDPLYFDSAEADALVPMNRALYQRIQGGEFRL